MSIRRVSDDEKKDWRGTECRHPEHNPPMHICLPPGTYEHTCPQCGHVIRFTVPGERMELI